MSNATYSAITDEDIKVLRAQDDKTLAKWWCSLNKYEWPDDLPNPEPNRFMLSGRYHDIFWWIRDAIGFKACLREWNAATMTDEQFDTFWEIEMQSFLKGGK